MSEAATIFKTFNLEVDGESYTLSRPSMLTEGAYARHLIEMQAAELKLQQANLGPAAFKEAMNLHLDQCNGNHFGWMRPGFVASLGKPKNIAKFLWLWIKQHTDKVPKEAAIYEAYRNNTAAIDEVLKEVFSDPNPLPP